MNRRSAFGLLAAVIFLSASHEAEARKKRVTTTRPRLERMTGVTGPLSAVDTVAPWALDSILLSGYDKPLRSRRESIFVTNKTDLRLTRLILSIDYYDMDGRELHHEDVEVGVDIPAGATRQILFTSWDRQLTFVYYRSERSTKGVLYKISAKVAGARGKSGE